MLAHADSIEVDHCTRIHNDSERLACYDKLFRPTGLDEAAIADAELIAESQSEITSELSAKSSRIDEFGAEQIEFPPVTFIESRLVGDFNGWNGKTVFTLENGQVWRQVNNNIRDYSPPKPLTQPVVMISKGMFGSYNMQVDGVKRIVQVKRVK